MGLLAPGSNKLRSASRVCPWTSPLQYLYQRLLLSLNISEACNYADDITLLVCDVDIEDIITRLELDLAIKWFSDNDMKINEYNCHIPTMVTIRNDSVSVKIGNNMDVPQ